VVHPEAAAGHDLQPHPLIIRAERLNEVVHEAVVAVILGVEDRRRWIERAGPATLRGWSITGRG
jgi:hypothetical protein